MTEGNDPAALGRADGEQFRERLSNFVQLDLAQTALDEFREKWGRQIVCSAGGKPWTELFDGIIAARSVGATEIRLTEAGTKADLELMVDGCKVQVQHVRILPSAQRNLNSRPGLVSYDPDEEIEWVLSELFEQVRRKAAKGYDPSFVLLAHIEMFKFESRRLELINRVHQGLNEGGRFFAEVWATWQGKLYRLPRAQVGP